MIKKKKNKIIFIGICLFIGLTMTPLTGSSDLIKLKEINQEHLLQNWDHLSDAEKEELASQVQKIDVKNFNAQRESILNPPKEVSQTITPFTDYQLAGSKSQLESGKRLIAEGKVGCLIVAGGQGSRLGYDGPKGLFPVTVVKKKSLFQLFAEKVLAAGHQVNRALLVAIMTSSANHAETVSFFEENDYFGLAADQIFFFSQTDLPFLDQRGNLFLETPSKIAAGPDGNAASLKHFVDQNIWSDWYERGIRYLNYIHIDNALADPYDAELIGFHQQYPADLVIKCIKREDPLEKVGVILKNHDQVQVIEYSEIKDEERLERDENGVLRHLCANISMFSLDMDFVKTVADHYYYQLPFHKAWKATKYLTESGETKMSEQPRAWKFEKFIFDIFPYATQVKALLYRRELCFAPLKNATGPDSIEDVKKALQRFDRIVFQDLTQSQIPDEAVFELDPQFYYPTESIKESWSNKRFPNSSYINP